MPETKPEKTTVSITTETWDALNQKKGVGDSFDDIIARLIQEADNQE